MFRNVLSIFLLVFGFWCISAFSYGKEFSFRVKIEPPAASQQTSRFQVVIDGTKVNFYVDKNVWSEWTKVDNAGIDAIRKQYPNLYLGRYPLVFHIRMVPSIPETKIYLECEVDSKQYSGQALFTGSGAMNVGILQWEEDGITKMGTMAQYNNKYWHHINKAAESIGEIKRPEKTSYC